jgi:hypothetical protein
MNEGPLAAHASNQAVALEVRHRLADGAAREAELFGKDRFGGEEIARLEPPVLEIADQSHAQLLVFELPSLRRAIDLDNRFHHG